MAHVLDLPGCFVRAPSQEEALQSLPAAIRGYLEWLNNHGEPAKSEEENLKIEIADQSFGFGPFDPGDAAALFPPDRKPLDKIEMEVYFRRMGFSRADLLAAVVDLSGEVLDWQSDPQTFTIRQLLRHIGNAEEWYVSRIVLPETLPAEWENDEGLPILEFLEMERYTAIARLRQLTEQQMNAILYQTKWTQHPDEPWTTRKVLRRFVEHEREHTAQIHAILTDWHSQ